MLDLLLINPGGRKRIYQGLGDEFTAIEPPLWCRLIAGYCRDRGWSVDIIDAEAQDLTAIEVASYVGGSNPRLTALVVYGHQPSASTQQMAPAHEIAVSIKKLAPVPSVIMLGGHVAALPERTLREEPIDFACNSEGPETVHQLLNYPSAVWSDRVVANTIQQRSDDIVIRVCALSDVQGLVWRDGDAIRSNDPPPLIQDLDKDLHGDVWDLLPMGQYRAHNWQCFDGRQRAPYASIMTSLGCPYKCVFCCINSPFGTNRYRMRSPAYVVAEIDMLVREYGVKTFKIIDEMFVLNDRHVKEICERLAMQPYAQDLNIWAYARVDTVKDHQPEMLRAAGIRWLALGIESASSEVRDGAAKSFDDEAIIDTVRKIQAAGINVIGNFIFGLPDDTLPSMVDTLELAMDLNCEFANFYSAMAYPGSRLFTDADLADLPESWAGYSQHAADTKPLPTATLASSEVLDFRDKAFTQYFTSVGYLSMIQKKFGSNVHDGILRMVNQPFSRSA